MPYIYKITNDINNKIYIGKTLQTIEKRWKEHSRDYKRENINKRPLYLAMKKYGIEHFHIEEIEECSLERSDERERYWIEYYGSFKYGYNATIDGDGRPYCDYDLIYTLFKEGLNVKQIAEKLKYSVDTCRKALYIRKISHNEIVKQGRKIIQNSVIQLDKNTNEILNIFPSLKEAYIYLNKQQSGHIAEVCKGKRKTAYGYKWKYSI